MPMFADLPEEHRQAFLGQLEHMQVRDRCATADNGAMCSVQPRSALIANGVSSACGNAPVLPESEGVLVLSFTVGAGDGCMKDSIAESSKSL